MFATPLPIRELRLSLTAWTVRLTEQYPGFDEYDLAEMIEEKTGTPILLADFETIRAVYLRSKLRAWLPDPEGD